MTKTLVRPLPWGQPVVGVSGKNERCIELPLVASFIGAGTPGRVLDAGCALNQDFDEPVRAHVTHLTQNLGDESIYEHPQRHYVQADFRDLSVFPDQTFDRVAAISSLEHVGCDNRTYGAPYETCPETVTQAVQELWRVTAGTLLMTVPFRLAPWTDGTWRYFTPATIGQIHLAPETSELVFYRRLADGWAGPFPDPGPSLEDEEGPRRVQQIAVIRRCR